MLSHTLLGDHGGGLSLFTRKTLTNSSPSATSTAPRTSKNGLDDTPTFKIALVGGPGVGKTSILRRWLQRPYASKYSPTIGVDVISTPFRYKTHEVHLHIWDVASGEADNTQSALHALICEDLDGIFFVFNVHRVSSIAAVDKWRHGLAKYISATEIPFFLLSHKADMTQKRIMSSEDIASYAKAGGYRGWMWTVGRPNFGENEKAPAVLEALECMVEYMWKQREQRLRTSSRPVGMFDSPNGPARLETIHVDADLHRFSAALLRIPTKAITTLPRDENLQPIEEDFATKQSGEVDTTQELHRCSSYGGNWMLGNEKGIYLRVTDDSIVADRDETDDDDDHDDADETKGSEGADSGQEGMDDTDAGEPRQDSEAAPEVPTQAVVSPRSTVAIQDAVVSEEVAEKPTPEPVDQSDYDAWRFFAGSISRARAEGILSDREEGTFLLRRKDAQTLILSYVGSAQVYHALLEYKNHKYHVGVAKSSLVSFANLSRCLRSVRKYAFRGLVFTRNTDFRVVNKEEMALDEGQPSQSPQDLPPRLHVTTTGSTLWRPGSAKSTPRTPRTPGASPRKHGQRPSSGLQAPQEQVQVPPKSRIDELSSSFYEQLTQRLKVVDHAQKKESIPNPEDEIQIPMLPPAFDTQVLLTMAANEYKQLQGIVVADAEAQWRQLVKNMELWNRILVNLEISIH